MEKCVCGKNWNWPLLYKITFVVVIGLCVLCVLVLTVTKYFEFILFPFVIIILYILSLGFGCLLYLDGKITGEQFLEDIVSGVKTFWRGICVVMSKNGWLGWLVWWKVSLYLIGTLIIFYCLCHLITNRKNSNIYQQKTESERKNDAKKGGN